LAYKRKGIIARPGVHRRLDGTEEVITWNELKEAVQFQNRIPLVLKHPATGYINPQDRIGTVTQRANEEKQVIEGEYWFFEEPEYWNQLPKDLQRMILSGDEIKRISAGYRVPKSWEGDYKPRHYDHIAIDVDNPMQDIGISKGDVRMESKLPEDFRVEETPTIEGEHKEEQPAVPKTEPYNPIELGIMIGELKAEVKQLREQLQTKPATQEKVEETRPEPEDTPKTAPPKPKDIIPQGSAQEKSELDEDGVFRFSG